MAASDGSAASCRLGTKHTSKQNTSFVPLARSPLALALALAISLTPAAAAAKYLTDSIQATTLAS